MTPNDVRILQEIWRWIKAFKITGPYVSGGNGAYHVGAPSPDTPVVVPGAILIRVGNPILESAASGKYYYGFTSSVFGSHTVDAAADCIAVDLNQDTYATVPGFTPLLGRHCIGIPHGAAVSIESGARSLPVYAIQADVIRSWFDTATGKWYEFYTFVTPGGEAAAVAASLGVEIIAFGDGNCGTP